MASYAEGNYASAKANSAHAEGNHSTASGEAAHSEGLETTASGSASHSEGKSTIANHSAQHVFGEYNIADPSSATAGTRGNYVEIVGNGSNANNRSNARTLDWDGNERLAGNLYVGCNADSTGGSKVATESFVTTRVPAPPSSDGTYYLKCVVSSGTPTYSWTTLPTANGVSF